MGSYPLLTAQDPIVFFDSHCLLCNRIVQFLLKVDNNKLLTFTSLSSKSGLELISNYQIQADSIVFFHQNKYSVKSNAVLEIFKLLGFPFSIMIVFYIIPAFLRDWMYNLIAQNRQKWFGTTDHCLVNSDEYRERIIL